MWCSLCIVLISFIMRIRMSTCTCSHTHIYTYTGKEFSRFDGFVAHFAKINPILSGFSRNNKLILKKFGLDEPECVRAVCDLLIEYPVFSNVHLGRNRRHTTARVCVCVYLQIRMCMYTHMYVCIPICMSRF
jgi:hypothetical protein